MVAMTILEIIQHLQFTDPVKAQDLLRDFIATAFGYEVREVALRPLAVSLNSFNGFVTLQNGRRMFFKSHVEPDSVITEYYNSDLLRKAGYELVMPIAASTKPGSQMLLYEVIEDRSVFDVAWALERGEEDAITLDALTAAQHRADDDLLQTYLRTLTWQEADAHASAPIHQLFYHRLTGGRLRQFYGEDSRLGLPGGREMPLEQIRRAHWRVNDVVFDETLDDVITRAERLLNPRQAGPAVVGHGDAHNGNVFLRDGRLVYFDPAFAGRHDPLLDLVKPLYHNVHAMWMYFPRALEQERGARLEIEGDTFVVTYNDRLPAVRDMFWGSKTQRVLIPTLKALKAHGWLREDWRLTLQSAMACCPLLTMNLADSARFPLPVALLGMAHVLECGATSSGSGRIELWLDEVEDAL
jgi:hypothetical protein